MDKKWLEQETEAFGLALARQGIRLAVPFQRVSGRERVFQEVKDGSDLAAVIDHTLLKPNASQREIRKLCQEAREYQFASVCVNPVHVPLAQSLLADSVVKVGTVIGFPLGATRTLVKVWEARDAIAAGAEELDLVLNIGSLVEQDYAKVYADLRAVREASPGRVLKVILETGFLSK
ncbi:MAG: deoxyribose-phosphate aldolase, partial [Firmicutes bacterium]|nr:deoxyribose-phosphate aldolase [Bacillota bacterium]